MMKYSKVLIISVLIGLTAACLFDEKNTRGDGKNTRSVHWSYDGASGPEHWGELDGAFASCSAGHKQTPVNILFDSPGGVSDYKVGQLKFLEQPETNVAVTHNGHTVVVAGTSGNKISGGPLLGDEYSLLQFHFHSPSEHTFNGLHYPLEVHFVHQNANTGDLAVVGVLFEIGTESNEWLDSLFKNLPHYDEDEGHQVPSSVTININPYDGIPEDKSYFHYMGSLTTPPCSEGLKWIVMKEVAKISEEQLEEWESAVEFSSRPVQSLNGRSIFFDNETDISEDDGSEDGQDGDDGNGSSSGSSGNEGNHGAETIINFNFAGMIN